VAQIVRERERFSQILIETKGPGDRAGDLRDFQAMRKPRAQVIPLVADENLRLVLQTPERVGMNDTVAVALEGRAQRVLRLVVKASARRPRIGRIGRPPAFASAQKFWGQPRFALPEIDCRYGGS
jgi:hypothetical protein